MSRVTILVLIGLPASGKSSFVKHIFKEGLNGRTLAVSGNTEDKKFSVRPEGQQRSDESDRECLSSNPKSPESVSYHRFHRVTYDEIMPADSLLFGPDDNCLAGLSSRDNVAESEWKRYRKEMVKCVECHMRSHYYELLNTSCLNEDTESERKREDIDPDLWGRFESCVSRNATNSDTSNFITYIIDDNMYYRSMRYEYYQLARKYQIGFAQMYFLSSVLRAEERNACRSSQVPVDVISKMAKNIEPPDDSSHWEFNSLSHSLEDFMLKMHEVQDLITQANANPVRPVPLQDEGERIANRIICSTNVIHQSDKFLRKLVASTISTAKGNGSNRDELRHMAKEMNDRRSKILADMRTGILSTDRDIDLDDKETLYSLLKSLFNTKET